MGGPAIAFAGGAFDEEDFGVGVFDPFLSKERLNVCMSLRLRFWPVGVGGCDSDDEGDRSSSGAFGRRVEDWIG